MLTDNQIEYLKETFLFYLAKDIKTNRYHYNKRCIISENISASEFYEVANLTESIFHTPYFEEIDRLEEENKNEGK